MRSQNLVRGPVRQNLLAVAKFAPYLFLWIDSMSFFMYKTDVYPEIYLWILSLSGHSVGWVIYTSILLYVLRVCLYTWVCMVSLLLFNLLSFLPVSDSYYEIGVYITIFTGIIMSTILILTQCFKRQYSTL